MRLLFLLFSLWIGSVAIAQSPAPQRAAEVESRLVFIGDAGALVNGSSVVMRAARQTVPFDEKTTVVFLGDNLYRHGLPDDQALDYAKYRAVLDSQIAIADGTPASVYFIPGNHDWVNGQSSGYNAVMRQQRYINTQSDRKVHFLPEGGCPGPEVVEIGENAVLVIIDSQWWLHNFEKPGLESDCDSKTKLQVLDELKSIVAKNENKLLLFACHHPFRSNGQHGGYYTWKQHIFPFTDINPKFYIPLPVLGSIYPITRSVFGTTQDMKHPNYADMINTVEPIIRQHPNPVFLAGHEHALQYFKDSAAAFIGSGSGCKRTRVSDSRESEYVADSLGYVVVNIYTDKTSDVQFHTVKADGASQRLAYYDSLLADFSKLPELKKPENNTLPEASFKDSVLVKASNLYANPNGIKRLVLGQNYRKEWSTPVKMRVFKIKEERGGMKIVKKGGGMQTRSLRLVDSSGREWVLRTVDKDPESVLPEGLQGTFARKLVQDVISSSHPYGALAVPPMATALGIIHTKPEIVFVGNDENLGYYRNLFANQVCLLEERAPVEEEVRTRSTDKVFNKIIEEDDHIVDQKTVLRARLLDMFIGDWDRHFDQWRFSTLDTGKGKVYIPIPRDRDQVFFNNNGLLLNVVAYQTLPQFSGFKHKMRQTKHLGFNARYFDRIFMNNLSEKDWREALHEFDSLMTDSVIEAAVRRFPPEIYAISGPLIAEKLRARKAQMLKEGIKYERFLSQYVDVLGSQQAETFEVKKLSDTAIQVKVYDLKKNGVDTSLVSYNRIVNPRITEEIRLYGFNSRDKFVIDESVQSRKLKIRIIGGKGADTFDVRGRIKNFIYDFTGEKNTILADRKSDLRLSANPLVNEFDYRSFRYDQTSFPAISASYNQEDGILVGGGIKNIKYGFRKDPFQHLHSLTALTALREKALRINYRGEFVHLIRYNDVVVDLNLHTPTLNNFYGLGNETTISPDKDLSYYRTRYNFASGDFLIRRRVASNVLSVSVGPTVFHYWNQPYRNEDKILENPTLIGLDNSVYRDKTYVGGKAIMRVNNIGNTLFPTRGIDWTTSFESMAGVSGDAKPITKLTSEMNIYAALSDPAKFVAVLRLGGGKIFSDSYEYFQALGLGQNNYLRGFRRNRFSGESMAYGSLEARVKLLTVNSYILPGSLGVVGFGDVGRVWVRNDQSAKWHFTPGAGFYYTPFNLVLVSGTVAFSEEETLFNITIGTRFNLTF